METMQDGITGRELLTWLQSLPADQLDRSIMGSQGDSGYPEYLGLQAMFVVGDGTSDEAEGILDEGTPILVFN